MLIALLLAVVTAGVTAILFLMIQNYNKVRNYNAAVTAYDNNNLKLAESLLMKCLHDDPNNEGVLSKLATVYEKLGAWGAAGMSWSRAARLNAFKTEYVDNMLAAFLQGGNFDLLKRELSNMQPLEAERHILLLAFADAQLHKMDEAAGDLKQLKDSSSLNTPLGKLVKLEMTESLTPEDISKLKTLSTSRDAPIAFYSLMALANYCVKIKKPEEAVEYLKKSIAIYPENGTLYLAKLYYLLGQPAESIKFFHKIKFRLSPVDAICYGEALASTRSLHELKSLAKKYRIGQRLDIMAGYYLDALTAFLENNHSELSIKLNALDNYLPNTPISQMLMLYNAVNTHNVNVTTSLLEKYSYAGEDGKILPDYVQLLKAFVSKLLVENDVAAAARIASLVQYRKGSAPIFERAIITDLFQKGSLSEYNLEKALKKSPNNPELLLLASDFNKSKGKLKSALQYVEKLLSLEPDNIKAQLQEVSLLETDGQIKAATQTCRSLYYKNPGDSRLLMIYLGFCARYKLINAMNELALFLSDKPEPDLRIAALLVKAEVANLEQNRQEMSKLLTEISKKLASATRTPINTDILFRTAQLLGAANFNEQAIEIYEKLFKIYPKDILIMANLSELYAAAGTKNGNRKEIKKALNLGKLAYSLNPNSPIVRECYASRLFDNKDYKEAETVLYYLVRNKNASPRALEIWRKSVENIIKKLHNEGEIYQQTSYCKTLLRIFPDNRIARERLQALKEKEETR